MYVSDFDTSSCKDIMEQISADYQGNVEIEDYQPVQIRYHDDFCKSNLQVIKIDGNYYLYFYGNMSV